MPIGALDIIIAADTAQLRKGMDEAVGIMKSSTKTMESAAKTAAGAIAGYFAFDSIRDNIKHTLDQADAISKMSQKIGVSVDSLYAMQAAGQLADVELQSIEKSLLKFNKGLGDAERGTGNTSNALKNLDISLKDSSGHLKTSDQYLFEVADKFKAMPDGIAKSTLAMDLFGKTGADMIPLLNGGSEALKEYSGVINTETAQSAERFNDSMTKIGLSTDASSTRILTGMLPTIESLSGTFEDMADWVLKNQSTIDEFTAQAGNDLTALGMVGADAFILISDTSGDMLKVVIDVFDEIPGLMGRSSDEAIENFGFFEYFILGMSTATNGLGQFVANAKMAYASVTEAYAKYGSITGLITNGGYEAAKARMDYHSASLDAQGYTKNVSDTYERLIGLKKEFKSKSGGSDPYMPPIDLEDYDKKEAARIAAQKKQAKERADAIQALNDEGFKFAQENIAKQEALEKKATEDTLKRWEDGKTALIDYYTAMGDNASAFEITESDRIQKLAESGILTNEQMLDVLAKDNDDFRKEQWDKDHKFWADLFINIDKAMEDQFFNAMTGKFESFGSWLKDFWSSITQSMTRGLSKSLADTIMGTGNNSNGGIVNWFKSFGGFSSVLGATATPAALIGATTDGAGFTTTAGGTVFDVAGQITKQGSDLAAVSDALNIASTANTAYSVLTGGLASIGTNIATGFGYLAEGLNYAGFTSAGAGVSNFGLGAGSVFTGGEFAGASAMGAGQLLGGAAAGALGGYALGSLGDSLFGADTRAGSYGAIGGGIGGAVGTFILPGVGTAIGAGIGATLGSLIGGMFGKTKQTGSGYMALSNITSDGGLDSVLSYMDFRKKSWFSSSSWTNYYGLTEKDRKAISGIFQTYDYLLEQLGDVDSISVAAGRYSGTTFFNAIDKSFIRAFIDNPTLTDTFYTAWTEYAKEIGKAVQETFATMASGYVDYTRSYKTWMLESSGNTLESMRLQSEWAQGDLNAYSNLIGVSGVTAENYLDMYSQAIKTTFTPETITNWQKLGDALKKSTELTKSYTDALKNQASYIPADMMLQKVGATTTAIDIKQLVDQNGTQTDQNAQMIAILYEVVKVLKQQFTIAQLGINQGIPA